MRPSAVTAQTHDTAAAKHEHREPRRTTASIVVLTTAELAECTCPDACDRDHDRD